MTKQFSVLVDTIERHTRRYTIEAEDADEAEEVVYSGACIEYLDTYEDLYRDAPPGAFTVVEVQEVMP